MPSQKAGLEERQGSFPLRRALACLVTLTCFEKQYLRIGEASEGGISAFPLEFRAKMACNMIETGLILDSPGPIPNGPNP